MQNLGYKDKKISYTTEKADNETFLKNLECLINKKTKVIFMSHILYTSGIEIPIMSICNLVKNINSNIAIIIDGAQAVGHIDVDVKNIGCDIYSFTGGKWLCGPTGTGGVYISESIQEELELTYCGWNSIINDKTMELRKDARRFEVSTKNIPLIGGLSQAIDNYFSNYEKGKIGLYVNELRKFLINNGNFYIIAPFNTNNIITFKRIGLQNKIFYDYLTSKNIICKIIDKYEAIRFSISYISRLDFQRIIDTLLYY